MTNGFSSDPRRPIPPAADESSAAGDRLALTGSWIEADADLERVRKRALCEALGAEQERLRSEAALAEERLYDLDAEMHLALARDREDRAREAVRRIIALRRHSRELQSGIERIARERERLAAGTRARPAWLPFPPTPSSASPAPVTGLPASRVSSGTPASRWGI